MPLPSPPAYAYYMLAVLPTEHAIADMPPLTPRLRAFLRIRPRLDGSSSIVSSSSTVSASRGAVIPIPASATCPVIPVPALLQSVTCCHPCQTLAPVAETGFSHRITTHKIVGHFIGLS